MENMTAEEYKKRSREFELREARKGLIAHSIVVAFVTILLASINLIFFPEVIWFIYPGLGMGLGVVVHYIFGLRLAGRWISMKERTIEEWR